MPVDRVANLGYLAMKVEATPGVAVTPDFYVPVYANQMVTSMNRNSLEPIVGEKFLRFMSIQGQRGHTGEVTTIAEPNSAARFIDMLLTRGNVSGSDPYTWPFTASKTTNPKSYTMDQSYGHMVVRFMGVQASQVSPTYEDNEMRLVSNLSALKSFTVRELAGTPTEDTGVYTITLKTDYDPSPTTGLVIGDTIQLYKADGSTINAIVDTIPTGTTVTVSEDVTGATTGDFLYLRPATPSYSLKTPFMWARTEFRFGADAAAALSATHTPLESDSNWAVIHAFNEEEGEKRSGSFDPNTLARLLVDAEFTAKRAFDTVDEANRWASSAKRAVVIRMFSESGYELRVTINHMKWSDGGVPPVESGGLIYQELQGMPQLDASDGQGVDIKVLNASSSLG